MDRPHLFIHSSTDGCLGFFPLLAIITSCNSCTVIHNAAINICIQMFLGGHTFSFLLGIYPGAEVLGLTVTICFMLTLLKNHHTAVRSSCATLHSQQQHTGVLISSRICQFLFFIFGSEVGSHCGFVLHFPSYQY